MIRTTVVGVALALCLLPANAYAATKNGANDYLLAQSTSGQGTILSKVIGRGCVAKTTFFMGTGAPGLPKNHALWSAKCSNGATFVVRVAPDGTNQVMECAVFLAMDGLPCFKKLPAPK